MTQRPSRERLLRKQGGFETRPYKSQDVHDKAGSIVSWISQAR
jgi:hypothetical protein